MLSLYSNKGVRCGCRVLAGEECALNGVLYNLQKREVEYDKYQMDKLAEAKADFRLLLKETKLITYKSRDLMNESERHYKDIITVLEVRTPSLLSCH